MALVRKSLEEIKAAKPDIDKGKIDTTSEDDIRRHMIEDGEDPDRELQVDDVFSPQVIRKRLALTQEQFAAALRIPLETLRNWEQGQAVDPAARSLLMIVARDPKAALAVLASNAA